MPFMIAISRVMGWVALSVGLLSTGLAHGQGESKKNCGPGRRPGIDGCVDAVPRARLKAESAKPRDLTAPKAESGLRLPSAERTPTEAAAWMLLKKELQQLEQLLKVTPRNAPERAALVRRLAETYAELARRAEYDRDVARSRAEHAEQEAKAAAKPPQRPRRPIRM